MVLLWWFAETSVVASVLALIAWALGRSKKLQLGAGARHLLWVVVLIKLLTPPVLWWPTFESPSPVGSTSPDVAVAASPEIGEITSAAPDRFDLDWDRLDSSPVRRLEPETGKALWAAPVRESSALPRLAPPRQAMPPGVRDNRLETIREVIAHHWVTVLVGLWAVGALVMAVRQTVRIFRFDTRMKTGREAPRWIEEDVDRIARSMRLRSPRAIVLPGTCVPMVWCLGRPSLVVPEALQAGLGMDGWRGVLTHELAHLKRGDHWVARLDLVASVIWWWSPLYRITRARIHELAELACDAWVVRVGPDLSERRCYAEALVEVCEQLSNAHAGMVLGVGVSGGAKSLEGRLHMILRESNPNPTAGRWAVVALGLMLLTLPGWAPPSQKPKPSEPAKPSDPVIAKESTKSDSRNPLSPAPDHQLPSPVLPPAPNDGNPFNPIAERPAQPLVKDGRTPTRDSAPKLPPTPIADPPLPDLPPTADPFHLEPSGHTPTSVPALAARNWRIRESDGLVAELYGVRKRAALVRDMTALITVWSERRERNGATDTRMVTVSTEDYSLDNKGNGRVDKLFTLSETTSEIRRPIEYARWVQARSGSEQFSRACLFNGAKLQFTYESVFGRSNSGPQFWVTQPEVYFLGYWGGAECPSARFDLAKKTTTSEMADGKRLIRQTLEYRDSRWNLPMKIDIWVSPELGYAPVRIEYQGVDPKDATALTSVSRRTVPTPDSLTTVRVRFRDFEKRGELHFPKRIELITDQVAATGAILSRTRTRVVIDDLKINQGLVESSFLPSKLNAPGSFDQEGDGPGRTPLASLGDRFSNFQFPPGAPEQIRRFQKALAASPFGPPCTELIATSEQPPQEQPVVSLQPAAPPRATRPAQPTLRGDDRSEPVLDNPIVPQPPVRPIDDGPSASGPATAPFPPPERPSRNPSSQKVPLPVPGRIARPIPTSPNSGLPLPVEPETPDAPFEAAPAQAGPAPVSPIERSSPVDASEIREPTLSPNVPTPPHELEPAADPALSPSTITGNSHHFAIAELKDELDLMKVRLNGKLAEIKAAKGRVEICAQVTDTHHRLAQSNSAVVSKGETDKAEGELTIAKAELEQKMAQLQEAELRIKQAERKIDRELKRLKRAIESARQRVEDIQRKSGKMRTPAESEAKAELQTLLEELESAGGLTAKPD